MSKFLGYLAIAGVVWLTYKQFQKAKNEDTPKIKK